MSELPSAEDGRSKSHSVRDWKLVQLRAVVQSRFNDLGARLLAAIVISSLFVLALLVFVLHLFFEDPLQLVVATAVGVVVLIALAVMWWDLPRLWAVTLDKSYGSVEYHEAVNSGRTTLAASIGTALLVIGLLFTWMQVRQTQETVEFTRRAFGADRFTEGTALIASDDKENRAHGLRTLEQASTVPAYYWPALQEIAEYARATSPRTVRRPCDSIGRSPTQVDYETALLALAIIARRPPPPNSPGVSHSVGLLLECIDFTRLTPRNVSFANGNFENVLFTGADLSRQILDRANFKGAVLEGASFNGAQMDQAQLSGATHDGGTCFRNVNPNQWASKPTLDFEPTEPQLECTTPFDEPTGTPPSRTASAATTPTVSAMPLVGTPVLEATPLQSASPQP